MLGTHQLYSVWPSYAEQGTSGGNLASAANPVTVIGPANLSGQVL